MGELPPRAARWPGYPFRLSAAQIPLESRIVAVADVFTALTEERPYRRGMSGREAAGILGDMADDGALDHDVVALMSRNRDEAAEIRRLAQEGAAGRYIAFRGHAPEAACGTPPHETRPICYHDPHRGA